jgi:hypothetical protein
MNAAEVTVTLTLEELKLLLKLAGDQLFREEFINPKMPGFRSNQESIDRAKGLIVRLQAVLLSGTGSDPKVRKTNGPRAKSALSSK